MHRLTVALVLTTGMALAVSFAYVGLTPTPALHPQNAASLKAAESLRTAQSGAQANVVLPPIATPEPVSSKSSSKKTTKSKKATGHSDAPSISEASLTRPTASSTGVVSGTKLTTHQGDLIITRPGTVISGLRIQGVVRVQANNVTIRNSIIEGGPTMTTDMGLVYAPSTLQKGLRLSHVEIYAANPSSHVSGVMGSSIRLWHVNIHDVIDQVHVFGSGHVGVYHSWLHDNLIYAHDPAHNNGPSHSDNIQIQDGTKIMIRGNLLSGSNNSAMQITQAQGATSTVHFTHNWASGGSCTVNVSQNGLNAAIRGLIIADNTFGSSSSNCAMIVDKPTMAIAKIENNRSSTPRTVTTVSR